MGNTINIISLSRVDEPRVVTKETSISDELWVDGELISPFIDRLRVIKISRIWANELTALETYFSKTGLSYQRM